MKKKILAAALALAVMFCLTVPALADGGDGSGGGSDDPLALASSSVPDGSTDVAVDSEITLTFNKNVVNLAVHDNNMTCFTLTDANGTVAIDVLMGDDQVDPTIKRIVVISPQSDLSPDTQYKLTISGNLTAKSGAVLGSDIEISFTTASAEASPEPSQSAEPSPSAAPSPTVKSSPSTVTSAASPSPSAEVEDTLTETPESAEPSESVEESPDSVEDTEEEDAEEEPIFPWYIPVGIVVVLIVGGGIYMSSRRKK